MASSQLDRHSEHDARQIIERLCATPEARRAWAQLVNQTIETASAVSDQSWEITLFRGLVRLNVGQVSVLELFPGVVGIYTEGNLRPLGRPGIELVPWRKYLALPVPSQRWLVTHEALVVLPQALIDAHKRLTKTAAMAKARSPFRHAHSPGVVAYLDALPGVRRVSIVSSFTDWSESTAAFGDPESNKLIERRAVDVVTRHQINDGWTVRPIEAKNLGYDLLCTRGSDELHVEVKGVGGECGRFIITNRELRVALSDQAFVLALVDRLGSDSPRLRMWSASQFRTSIEVEPIQYWARVKGAADLEG
jgi:hypothetical protein